MFRSKNKFIRIFSASIASIILATSVTVPVSARDFNVIRSYNGQFTDISKSDWYYSSVTKAYEVGIISGKTDSTFVPSGNVTLAETIKLAAVTHRYLVSGGVDDSYFTARYPGSKNWYDPYVRYCTTNGIVTETYPDYNAAASRAQVAVLFSRAITSSKIEIYDLNTIQQDTIKDVPTSAWYISAIYKMYRWGIITGDGNGYISPEYKVKRSEVAAIVMRMIDEDERVDLDAPTTTDPTPETPETTDTPTPPDTPTDTEPEETTPPDDTEPPASDNSALNLYEGEFEDKAFTGITAVGGEFTVNNGEVSLDASYSIDHINDVILESNNISFKLYEGYGFEALGIIRGWLGDAAVGIDGKAVRSANEVYTRINELFYIWVGGERHIISELWYADHGEYSTYAFYFEEDIVVSALTEIEFMLGKVSADSARSYGLDVIANRIENAGAEETPPPSGEDIETPAYDEEAYKAAIEDAKYDALSIIMEYECDRCTILYGRGLYGGYTSDYRLILIFRDGSTLVVAKERLNKVRLNDEGTVLYYTVDAPDGMEIQYGINLKLQ